LNSPWDVVKAQDALWIAMAGTHQIWRYDPKTMKVEPWIGSGHENILDGTRRTAQLAQPSGLSANEQSLFFADSETSAIRRFDWQTEEVTTLVGQHLFIFGSTDGDLDEGLLQHPLGVAVDGDEVFVADTYNRSTSY
jgi:sugar lactone lactonase YvrE